MVFKHLDTQTNQTISVDSLLCVNKLPTLCEQIANQAESDGNLWLKTIVTLHVQEGQHHLCAVSILSVANILVLKKCSDDIPIVLWTQKITLNFANIIYALYFDLAEFCSQQSWNIIISGPAPFMQQFAHAEAGKIGCCLWGA